MTWPYPLWRLILHATLPGHGASKLNIISGCICEGVSGWDEHLNGWLSEIEGLPWGGRPHIGVGRHHSICWGSERNKRQRKEKLFPFFLISLLEIEGDRRSLLVFSFSSTWIHTTTTHSSQAFRVWLNHSTGSPGFVACSQEIVEFFSLHKKGTKLKIILKIDR